ncbi:MAG: Ig-like domain-containing protein [Actinomycetota bacterium]
MRLISVSAAFILLTTVAVPGSRVVAQSTAPTAERASPPGQISVVTINAKQGAVLGVWTFRRLLRLVEQLNERPLAFDGGFKGAVAAPDVILLQEMRPSNREIFSRLLNQQFNHDYSIVGPENSAVGILANVDMVEPIGEAVTWNDACITPATPDKNGRTSRPYPIARFAEIATGTPFTVAGVHFARHFSPDQEDCLRRNVTTLRSLLAAEPGPVVVAGDFNKRATVATHECDPDERSDPLPWYQMMTEPIDGAPSYDDAARTFHRRRGASMLSEWTFERNREVKLCHGRKGIKRGRIDYVFGNGVVVAEGHADHPGWSGGEPGTKHPDNFKYSDHRFLWSRMVIAGPPRPQPPTVTLGAQGDIQIAWQPLEGATDLVLLRAVAKHDYGVLARLAPDQLSYTDSATRHGVKYRYSLAPVGPSGGQGLESRPSAATADARGPKVVRVTPAPGATDVPVRVLVEVRVNERVDPKSFDPSSSIRLFKKDRLIAGRAVQRTGRYLIYRPFDKLKKGVRYRVVLRGLRDKLGNRGDRFAWRFTTEEPKKRRKR